MEGKVHHVNYELQSLRGIAIILTLLAHISFVSKETNTIYIWIIQNLFQFWGGVYLFFVISGYLIGKQLLGLLSPHTNKTELLKVFFIKRFFRIVPVSYFWIIMILLLTQVFNKNGSFGNLEQNLSQAFAAIFFYYNFMISKIGSASFGIYWSLSAEEQFYIIIPFLFLIFKRNIITVLALIIIAYFFIYRPANQTILWVSLPFDALAWGVALNFIPNLTKNRYFEISQNNPLFIISLLLLMIIYLPIATKNITSGTSLIILPCVVLVYLAKHEQGLCQFPQHITEKLNTFGKYSYSIYLAHMPAFLLTKELSYFMNTTSIYNMILSTIIAFFITSIFSYISFYFIEIKTRYLFKS